MNRANTIISQALIAKNQTTNMRDYSSLTGPEFKALFLRYADEIISNSYQDDVTFKITPNNQEVINQMFYYLTGSKKFNGNLNKGILLMGPYGTGKTTILKILADIVFISMKKRFHFISCVNLVDDIKIFGMDFFYKRPMIIDEIGREPKVVKEYGTDRHPIQELLSTRYNQRSWTMATSNYNHEDLGKMYGGYIGDRLNEMFNFIELKGKSFRK